MSDQKSWFDSTINKRKILSLKEPVLSKWKLVEKLNEHVEQRPEAKSHTSLASARFLCRDASRPANEATAYAYLRIVKQIPSERAEEADLVSRAREATQFTPPELKAYKALAQKGSTNTPKLLAWEQGTQDSTGPMPGGHITWIVFEKLEGLTLGDDDEASSYWALPSETRKSIRSVFLREFKSVKTTSISMDDIDTSMTISKAAEIGILPVAPGPHNVIWNAEKETIHFVGFRDPEFFQRKREAGNELFPLFGLAKAPRGDRWAERDWDGDTSKWKF
ncbi:hypothetical protein N7474_000592 [Penicillium riverlandense]|uniref:uncharacterized protein n=1 Tax=Penicillium riverlandense TaxID=1903569 RepID=UPI002548807E|nr:uncharacterized protein N7474_000592 [Penicillium riverlandense]KAJ5832281.1 hypothetical protein N7474_000592 [Penicillium riverlandense]